MLARVRKIAVAGLATLVIPALSAAQTLAVPDHAPAGAAAVISLNDAPGMWKAFSETPVRKSAEKLIALPAIQGAEGFKEFLLERKKAEGKLGFGLTPEEVLGRVVKGVDLYLVPQDGKDAAVVGVIQFAREQDATSVVKELTALAAEQAAAQAEASAAGTDPNKPKTMEATPAPAPKLEKVGDFNVSTMGPNGELTVAQDKDLLILSNVPAAAKSAFEKGNSAKLLSGEHFKSSFGPIAGTPGQVWAWGSGEELGKLVAQVAPSADVAGMLARTDMAVICNFTPTGLKCTSYETMERMGEAVQKYLQSTKPEEKLAGVTFADQQPLAAFASNELDLEKMLDASEAETADKPEMAGQVAMIKSAVEGSLGLDLRKDIAPAFGPGMGFSLNGLDLSGLLASQPPKISMVLALQLRDVAKADAAIATLEKKILEKAGEDVEQGKPAPTFAEEAWNGTKIRSLPMGDSPIALTHGKTPDGKFFVLGLSPGAVKGAMEASTGKRQNLASNPNYTKAMALLPKTSTMVGTVNIHDMAMLLGAFAPALIGAQDPDMMPAAMEGINVLKSLGSVYIHHDTDGKGVTKSALFQFAAEEAAPAASGS